MKLTAFAIAIGPINPKIGKTKYDWNVYDLPESALFICENERFLYAAPGTFKPGDEVTLRDNDSQRKLKTLTVKKECIGKDDVIKSLRELGYNMTDPRPFQKATGMKFQPSESYSIKGVTETSEYSGK